MNKDYINSWITIAIEDLETSKILYENKMYSNSFYHFQQASEKGLKAYAFIVKTFVSEKDANNTGHYTLNLFINSIKERQKEMDFLKNYEFEKLFGSGNMVNYSNNLESGLTLLPKRKEIFEYSNEILDEVLKTLNDLSSYTFELPNEFKDCLIDKMNLFFDLVNKINPEKAIEARNEFNDLMLNENQLNEVIEYAKEHFNYALIEYYNVLILFFSNLLSHNHNNKSRYPEIDFNPLKYYNLSLPIIQKLPELTDYLNSALLQLKKWN
ncbi:HEPN domain-containing protein [Flavivirga sp. 57AJ16]|uniref:HEPN domain-containing protein n=1 Tax=Flavivirga sp. 57AJ16 TaxID=3025307 RepID=UPI002365DD56|nr:HEPN domain-containing protein [Flavivirga sp. 57AJ16]MDD7885054.1 HEPN domain-containing protein [Flavivirga sp. 57AJ16]